MTGDPLELDCAMADELAAAYGLEALSFDESRAVERHLDSCSQPHAPSHELIAAAGFIPDALEPVTPSPALRARLMTTVAATPQDHAPQVVADAPHAERPTYVEAPVQQRRAWWQWGALPSAMAAVGLAAAVGLGAWNVSLNAQLADRETALRAVASADAAYVAQGQAGRGWVIQSGETAYFMADNLAALASDELYELWLIDGSGNAVAAGTFTDTDDVALVALEHDLAGAATFAVTVETERVEQPGSAPVIVASLES
ncbi:MAG: anti-sigma factor [Candidatus Limnocylindria bacterium]